MRLPGGMSARNTGLTPLPGFIKLTSSLTDVDMLTLMGDEDETRAIMPCGHCIGTVFTCVCHNNRINV